MKKIVSPYSKVSRLTSEVLFNIKELSRKTPSENLKAEQYKILNFDILCCERDWERTMRVFDQVKDQFDAIRVQDPGILAYVLEKTEKPIELILENGHHNWPAIERWVNFIGDRLKKIVLSYELPKNRIKEYSEKLIGRGIESEILLLGDILLFYSPRMLLDHQVKEKQDEIKLFADSEESPHKGFEVEQNLHGTFMYHLKKLCLLERLDEINKMKVTHLRLEYSNSEIEKYLENPSTGIEKVFESIPFGKTRGYFDINKSNVLFPKLKNEELERNREEILGEVISTKKGSYTAIRLKKDFLSSEFKSVSFVTGEGKRFSSNISEIKDLNGVTLNNASEGSLVIINHIKKATPRTLLFSCPNLN